jgi:two-component sensor histidine kinase
LQQPVSDLTNQLNLLSQLSKSTVGFLQLNSEDNLFKYISDQLNIFVPNALIVITEYDKGENQLICRHMSGFDELNKILVMYANSIAEGSVFSIDEDDKKKLLEARLYHVEGGIYEIMLRSFPKIVCDQIQSRLGVVEVLSIGLVWKGELFGSAVIITFNQTPDFTPSLVETFINTASVAIQRKSAEDVIVKSLREKEVMLKEIHHRVKNNLQIVSSLLELQAHQITDEATRALFSDSQSRVKSMALVHERLYRSTDLAHINYKIYLEELVEYLFSTFTRKNIRYEIDADEIMLDIDSAVPSGIIINELVTNSLKYAFPDGREGLIRLSLRQHKDYVLLEVSDNGIGMPESMNLADSKTLGLELVLALIEQLNASFELNRGNGTRFSIKIPA